MVNPVRGPSSSYPKPSPKKKVTKEVDTRVRKAVSKQSPSPSRTSSPRSPKASRLIAAEKAYLEAEKTAKMARLKAFDIRKSALKAQKSALLAERAHLAQVAAAAKRAQAAEKARKAAEAATRKAKTLRQQAKIRAYLARPEEKKRDKSICKYLASLTKNKKKN